MWSVENCYTTDGEICFSNILQLKVGPLGVGQRGSNSFDLIIGAHKLMVVAVILPISPVPQLSVSAQGTRRFR